MKEFRCPDCQAVILSRSAGICASCKHPLPKHLLLSKEEQDELDKHTKRVKQRAEKLKREVDASDGYS
jgi:predicted amidophosphoribosyltransferase